MESSIIRAEHLLREFYSGGQTLRAVNDVSLTIPKGSFTILRGRSGSGKTTLINLLSAMDMPTQGRIFYLDDDITEMSEDRRDSLRRRSLGIVFQSSGLMPYMSAYENVEFGLRIAGYPTKERRERAEECLVLVGLTKRMKHRPAELSGGEQQRVAIARAFAHKPHVLFADEPTSALDTAISLQIVHLFRNLIKSEGISVVMTTHDPSMIQLADNVVTLKDGEVVNE